MKVRDVFIKAINLLKSDTSKLDVKFLLSFYLDIEQGNLIYHFDDEIDEIGFVKLLLRRLNGEPIANIIGKKAFWDDVFFVDENVLTPRPDSETIIESVMSHYKDFDEKLDILDLGTGSGCLILTLLKIYKNSNGVGIDISDKALNVAKKNGEYFNNVFFLKNNWNENFDRKFDIIVSNPPYIPTNEIKKLPPEVKTYNPIISLDGGIDGLNCYRYLAMNLKKNMKEKTKVFLEIGKGQKKDVIEIFDEYKFCEVKKDYGNISRVVIFSL
ncbi:MAG: peptide chain release factor N(5)-glutamine methyltransferase [Rickettsiales bacterium]|jgi:release factor glutamine methyltransferase|nr:peptide chain release factor N(5)-glutamine methyltransferase [Rickettsiales bacterium]